MTTIPAKMHGQAARAYRLARLNWRHRERCAALIRRGAWLAAMANLHDAYAHGAVIFNGQPWKLA